MVIGRCQRSNDVIEPRLKTQWFIRTEPLAARALAATREGRTQILPERFEKTWEHWLTGIRDWNVSRQLWWGHRIPAWYCPDGHVTVSPDEAGPTACEVCGTGADRLQQDPDIFDTWFSSGLWPFSTLGWPDDTPDLRTFYPTSVMETGYDIIFFWVARMMMLGIHLTGREPFHTVYLSGLIRDPEGQKMSKTKGNVVDPLGVIDEAGADALRFALIHGATPGLDQRFGQAKLENARNFANKLWNATRFVVGARPPAIPEDAQRAAPDAANLGPAERWILSRVAATTQAVDDAMGEYAFGEVTRLVYDAIWSELCDWGLELAKVRLADETLPAAVREATWWTLVEALDAYLRLLHPVMPFVTEALWAALPHRDEDPDLLIVARWPGPRDRDEALEGRVDQVLELVTSIRNARATANVDAPRWLETHVAPPANLHDLVQELAPALARLTRARPLELHRSAADLPRPAGSLEIVLPGGGFEATVVTGAADAGEQERTRLERELAEAEGWLESARARLANAGFIDKAPPAVVDGARAREAELVDLVARLRERLGRRADATPPGEAGRPADDARRRRPNGRRRLEPGGEEESTLHGAAGDAPHEVALQGDEDDDRHDHRDERGRRQELPAAAEGRGEVRQHDGQRVVPAVRRRGTPGPRAGRSRPRGTGRWPARRVAGTLIGRARRKKTVAGLAPSMARRLEDLPWQRRRSSCAAGRSRTAGRSPVCASQTREERAVDPIPPTGSRGSSLRTGMKRDLQRHDEQADDHDEQEVAPGEFHPRECVRGEGGERSRDDRRRDVMMKLLMNAWPMPHARGRAA